MTSTLTKQPSFPHPHPHSLSLPAFADVYKNLLQHTIKEHPAPHEHAYSLPYIYEMVNCSLSWNASKFSIYSDKKSVAFPILLALSEFCWTLSGHIEPHLLLKPLTSEALSHILDNSGSMHLFTQVPRAISRLIASTNTWQSEFAVFQMSSLSQLKPESPRKAEIQFMLRDNHFNMIVNARSSDIIASLPIDAFQWQAIYHLCLNELNEISPKKVLPGVIYYNIGSLYMTQDDFPCYKKFRFPAYKRKFERLIRVYQSYSNVQFRSLKRFKTARSLSHVLNILDIGNLTEVIKLQRLFRTRLHRFKWENF